jgi:transposase
MVLLRESGMSQPAIAAAMGVSLSTVIVLTWPMTGAVSKRSSRSQLAGGSGRI